MTVIQTVLAVLPLLFTVEHLVSLLMTRKGTLMTTFVSQNKATGFYFFSRKLPCAEYFGSIIQIFEDD